MKFVICDPNLERASGHHWFLDTSIAAEAASRGVSTVILANRVMPASEINGIQIIPAFTHTCYMRESLDPVSGEHDDFQRFNDSLYQDLLALPPELLTVDSLVLFPTVTQRHLYGAVRWMKDLPVSLAPTFVVYLMLPSGIELMDLASNEFKVIDPMVALQYRLAFDLAIQPGPPVHFFGTGLSHAREFSLLARRQIDAHPVVLSGMTELGQSRTYSQDGPRTALLYMGDAKEDKGFVHMPEVVKQLTHARPDWNFLLHANCSTVWGVCAETHVQLKALASETPNFELHDSFISADEYAALLGRANLVMAPYSPEEYWRKSSGVVWEAIWCGLPAVVPTDTWLDIELQLWGSDGERFNEWVPDNIAQAVLRLMARLDDASAVATRAAIAFRRRNSLRLLLNQLADVWVARMALGGVANHSMTVALPLDQVGGNGWFAVEQYEGKLVRWSKQEIILDLKLDPDASWRFALRA